MSSWSYNIYMKKLCDICSFGFISLLPIQDSALSNLGLGFFGANLSVIFIPIMAALLIANKKIKIKKYWIVLIFLSLFYSLFFLLCYVNELDFNEFYSGVKLLIMIGFLIVVLIFYATFKISMFKASIVAGIFISLIGIFIFDVIKVGYFSFLHVSDAYDFRPRGFSVESSILAATVSLLLLSFMAIKKSCPKHNSVFFFY